MRCMDFPPRAGHRLMRPPVTVSPLVVQSVGPFTEPSIGCGLREAALLGRQRIGSEAVPLAARNLDDELPKAAERVLSVGADDRLRLGWHLDNPV